MHLLEMLEPRNNSKEKPRESHSHQTSQEAALWRMAQSSSWTLFSLLLLLETLVSARKAKKKRSLNQQLNPEVHMKDMRALRFCSCMFWAELDLVHLNHKKTSDIQKPSDPFLLLYIKVWQNCIFTFTLRAGLSLLCSPAA